MSNLNNLLYSQMKKCIPAKKLEGQSPYMEFEDIMYKYRIQIFKTVERM